MLFDTATLGLTPEAPRLQNVDRQVILPPNNAAQQQQQLMGQFSIHESAVEAHQASPDRASPVSPAKMYGNGNGNGNGNIEILMDTHPDIVQFQAFDGDFFSNETDMISDYLMGAFPPIGYETPFLGSIPESHASVDERMADDATVREPPTPQPAVAASTYQQVTPIQPQPTYQGSRTDRVAVLERDRTGGPLGALDAADDIVAGNPWAISAAAHERLNSEVLRHAHVLPEPFTLPNRHALSRYVASYIRGFHPHLPFIHLPTTCLDTMSPMLLLTFAATGSFYGFEHTQGYAMYFILKSIICEKLQQRRRGSTLRLLQTFPAYAELPTTGAPRGSNAPSLPGMTPQPTPSIPVDIELVQALLVFVLTMAWLDGPLNEDALAMSSQLSELVREALKAPSVDHINEPWKDWAREEERRRTLFSSYFLFNILTICFNLPPLLTNSEMDLPLPCSEAEFRAPNAAAWHRLRRTGNLRNTTFQDCLKQLLSGKPLDAEVAVTEYGNYLLVQGMCQQIYFERQSATVLLSSSASLPTATIKAYDAALAAWQACWGSNIDPASPHGPLAFNSTAMLRLAHIHLGVGLQNHCSLRGRDPRILAQAFDPHQNPIPLRSAHVEQAVLHAIYALRVPVRVGIAFVARGRTGHWSVQHAISHYTCALLLTHWLEGLYCLVASSDSGGCGGLQALKPEERRLLSMIERLVEETHLEDTLGPKDCYPDRIRRLAIAAVKLWAEICQGIQVFEIVHVVGETLSLVAESLERRLDTDMQGNRVRT